MTISLASHGLCCPRTKIDVEENRNQQEEYERTYQNYKVLLHTLPKAKGWMTKDLVQYQGHWLTPTSALKGVLLIQNHFRASPSTVFLATPPKCGTTWLRALMFATLNRSRFDFSTHPLLNRGPHDCFPFLDAFIYQDYPVTSNEALSVHSLFSTHIPYALLPVSVTASGCKFVYICREPKDVLVSKWHFMNKIKPRDQPALSLGEAFELFCEGVSHYGPYWDHVLGYWKASLESPEKIMFLKYEDMKREPRVYVRRLAEFMGKPFTSEEERDGVLESVLELCSFESLRNLDVNKSGAVRYSAQLVVNNCEFFRKGQVGDFKNYLTDEMVERLDRITEEKFRGSGLSFGNSI